MTTTTDQTIINPGPKPHWLRRPLSGLGKEGAVRRASGGLHTVCDHARCPNRAECHGRGEATFLLMGPNCTRACNFCAVSTKKPLPLDPDEPALVARAVAALKLKHCVLTMVTRDDLPGGGAAQVAAVIDTLHADCPDVTVEILISDLGGDAGALDTVLASAPAVLGHNLETIPRLYKAVRPQAGYRRSLEVLAQAARAGFVAKSGLMLGLGEEPHEVLAVMADLRLAGCTILTLGQYLAPSARHHPVVRWVTPQEFDHLRQTALDMGFKAVASAPLVRSSYKAGELLDQAGQSKAAMPVSGRARVEDLGLMAYPQALEHMRDLAAAVAAGTEPQTMLLVQHPPVITLGRRAGQNEVIAPPALLAQKGVSVVPVERGGLATCHGPGQAVIYPVLKVAGLGVRALVGGLEQAVIATLAGLGIAARRRPKHIGIWVENRKIGSIGLAVKKGVSLHGLALNNAMDLSLFGLIDPCGMPQVQMTSIAQERGEPADPGQLNTMLLAHLAGALGLKLEE